MPKFEFIIDRDTMEMRSTNIDTDIGTQWHSNGVAKWYIRFESEDDPLVLTALRDTDVVVITGKKKQ